MFQQLEVLYEQKGGRDQSSSFGQILKQWREKRSISQLDLATTSQVSQRHISFLESGRANPSQEMVLKLATVLEIPLRQQNLSIADLWNTSSLSTQNELVLRIHLKKEDLNLSFFSTIATLGTPYDITLQEIRIECLFPVDELTEYNWSCLLDKVN